MALAAEPQFDDLYRDILLDHFRRPRNRGKLASPTEHREGMNPVCGDEISIDLQLADHTIEDIAFEGVGCSISQSSVSMMTERLKGQSLEEARDVAMKFEAMLVDGTKPDASLGDLEALQGVAKFPVRVKCALLGWKVLAAAIGHQA
jgi:nitrogen fixation NifU-like protein